MPPKQDPSPALQVSSPLAGFLSYLVPGLGQIYQGRIGKGLLFLVCLYGMFFYGMALGSWKNVYLPNTAHDRTLNPWNLPTPIANLYNRMQFAGQFWIGVAAWPAIYQYWTYDAERKEGTKLSTFERTPNEEELNRLQREGDKTWDLGWVYTVIAGVLNILVIYDAFAGPAFVDPEGTRSIRQESATA
jgi:TM2 domain-containing membrane protein YozV